MIDTKKSPKEWLRRLSPCPSCHLKLLESNVAVAALSGASIMKGKYGDLLLSEGKEKILTFPPALFMCNYNNVLNIHCESIRWHYIKRN